MTARLFAIGDIHGCARELERLVRALEPAAGDTLVFVGDYVDRGADSRAVIDDLLDLARRPGLTTVFLKGNHEDMFLDYIGHRGHWGESWMLNGGPATLRSYGLSPHTPGPDVLAALPAEHVAFLDGLEPWRFVEDWLLVHAGINPERAWEEQEEEDLFWIREEFILRPHPLPQTVVFGHTPFRQVFLNLPYKLGIDTGCVYGGMLTAIELREGRLFQLRQGSSTVRTSPLPARS
jgi:serine/threonine protein phosphatase 1